LRRSLGDGDHQATAITRRPAFLDERQEALLLRRSNRAEFFLTIGIPTFLRKAL